MKETVSMMKTILLGYEDKVPLEELLADYKKTLKPNILAYIFVKYYEKIYNASYGYNLLTIEDRVSFCLQELDLCIHKYSFNRNCSFVTYFITCYKRRLRMETEQILTDLRYSNYVTTEIDNCNVSTYMNDELDIFENLSNSDLTSKELDYCKLLYLGYTYKEIAKIFKVSVQYIYKFNKKI